MQPNAGNPRVEQGEIAVSYTVDATVFGDYVQKLVKLGANMIGGCCGTTPAYITKIREEIAGQTPIERQPRIFVLPKVALVSKTPTQNPIQQVFETGERIVSVEARANTFPQLRALMKEAKVLAANGVDLFDVTDNSGAAVNIGAVGTAYRLQQATQIPTLIHGQPGRVTSSVCNHTC